MSNGILGDFQSESSLLLKPRQPLILSSNNVGIVKRASQQGCLNLAIDSLTVDVCFIGETRI